MVLRVVSNEQLMEAERKVAEEVKTDSPVTTMLESHLLKLWAQARDWKNQSTGMLPSMNRRLLDCLRTRRGVYTPEEEAEISKIGGSKIYSRVSDAKARTALSWLTDIFLAIDRPWTLKPTAIPDIPIDMVRNIQQLLAAEVAQLAAMGQPVDESALLLRAQKLKEQAQRKTYEIARQSTFDAEKRMEDQLVEGGFYDALRDVLMDFVTYPVAVMAGPFVEMKQKLVLRDGQSTVEEVPTMTWRRVSPFDIYPMPYVTDVSQRGVFERVVVTRDQLEGWRVLPNYNTAVINTILMDGASKNWLGLSNEDERAQLEGHKTSTEAGSNSDNFDGLMYWGAIPGKLLLEWGMEDTGIPDPFKSYPVAVLMVNGQTIYVRLNPDPLGRSPYSAASYEEVPGSWAGNALCEIIRDIQQGANNTLRSMMNNQAISSGPMVGINSSRLDPSDIETANVLRPWRVWMFQDDLMGNSNTPIEFFQPQSNAAELLGIYKYFMSLADDISGIPRYMAGGSQDLGSVGRTASGMSLLMGHATKSMKLLAQTLENNLLVPQLERAYTLNKLYNPEFPITADLRVVARGASGVMQKDALQIRRNEFLAATANPVDVGLVGPVGRALMLREQARELDLPIDDVVTDPDELKQILQAQQQQSQQNQKEPNKRPAAATMDKPSTKTQGT